MTNVEITILGFTIIFAATTLGAATVFLFKKQLSPKLNTLILGFAAGVMIAASIWSLLLPSIDQSSDWGKWAFVPALVGFLVGGLFMVVIDKVVPHIHVSGEAEGPKSNFTKTTKLFMAVTIHNIPEGLAVGFAFGGALADNTTAAFMGALGLAIGMSIQNFPEGAAIALPMQNVTGSKWKSFLLGSASGIVEPVFAVIGYFLASALTVAQPWFLAFAAGLMIFVVAEDLIPDAHLEENSHLGTWGVMLGFALMMVLEVALG